MIYKITKSSCYILQIVWSILFLKNQQICIFKFIYNWPLNNMLLNSASPLIRWFFSVNIVPVFSLCVCVCVCVCMCVRVCAQSCLNLCNPMNCSLPGSSVHGIFQARILEWVAISYSSRSSQPRDRTRALSLLHWREDSLSLHRLGSPMFSFYRSLINSR